MPITPVFEQPPVPRPRNAIDWKPVLDALVEHPGEWARVDGPFGRDGGKAPGREKSLRKFAEAAEATIETTTRNYEGERWLYARTVPAKAAPKPAPVVAVPSSVSQTSTPQPSPIHDDGTHTHQCDTCGDSFRTNARLRQHQANAHKAS